MELSQEEFEQTFSIQKFLGEGSFGSVFIAKGNKPIARSAVKKIKIMHLVKEAIVSNYSDSNVPIPSISGISDSVEKEVNIPKIKHQSTQVDSKKVMNIRIKGMSTNVQMISVGCQISVTGVIIGINMSSKKSESEGNLVDDDFEPDSSDFNLSDEDGDNSLSYSQFKI